MKKNRDPKKLFSIFLILFTILIPASAGLAQTFPIRPVFACNPVKVSTYKTSEGGRVWVQCNPPLDNVYKYFAVPLTDAAEAARFLSLFTTAFIAGKTLDIEYDPNDLSSGPQYNCKSSECRPVLSATIR